MVYSRLTDTSHLGIFTPNVDLDFDANNQVVGIEIEDASKFIDLSRFEILELPIASLVSLI